MTTESDILHENGAFWVCRERNAYTVFRNGVTAATSDSSYAKTPDGLSIAKARCDYLAKRDAAKSPPTHCPKPLLSIPLATPIVRLIVQTYDETCLSNDALKDTTAADLRKLRAEQFGPFRVSSCQVDSFGCALFTVYA